MPALHNPSTHSNIGLGTLYVSGSRLASELSLQPVSVLTYVVGLCHHHGGRLHVAFAHDCGVSRCRVSFEKRKRHPRNRRSQQVRKRNAVAAVFKGKMWDFALSEGLRTVCKSVTLFKEMESKSDGLGPIDVNVHFAHKYNSAGSKSDFWISLSPDQEVVCSYVRYQNSAPLSLVMWGKRRPKGWKSRSALKQWLRRLRNRSPDHRQKGRAVVKSVLSTYLPTLFYIRLR